MILQNGDGNIVMRIANHAQDPEMMKIINVILVKQVFISIVIKLKDMEFPVLAMIIA
jgi:hypothetical protein